MIKVIVFKILMHTICTVDELLNFLFIYCTYIIYLYHPVIVPVRYRVPYSECVYTHLTPEFDFIFIARRAVAF